jgi:hypothetical protein
LGDTSSTKPFRLCAIYVSVHISACSVSPRTIVQIRLEMTRFQVILVLALCLTPSIYAVDPDEVYDGGYSSPESPVRLRIANGGAGQSGLIKGARLSILTVHLSRYLDLTVSLYER